MTILRFLAAASLLVPAATLGGSVPAPPSVKSLYEAGLANIPGTAFEAVRVTYPPGGASRPHYHPNSAIVFAYVLAGHIQSQVEGLPVATYGPGEHWVEGPGAHHVIARNASSTESAQFLAVIVRSPESGTGTPTSEECPGAVDALRRC